MTCVRRMGVASAHCSTYTKLQFEFKGKGEHIRSGIKESEQDQSKEEDELSFRFKQVQEGIARTVIT